MPTSTLRPPPFCPDSVVTLIHRNLQFRCWTTNASNDPSYGDGSEPLSERFLAWNVGLFTVVVYTVARSKAHRRQHRPKYAKGAFDAYAVVDRFSVSYTQWLNGNTFNL